MKFKVFNLSIPNVSLFIFTICTTKIMFYKVIFLVSWKLLPYSLYKVLILFFSHIFISAFSIFLLSFSSPKKFMYYAYFCSLSLLFSQYSFALTFPLSKFQMIMISCILLILLRFVHHKYFLLMFYIYNKEKIKIFDILQRFIFFTQISIYQ